MRRFAIAASLLLSCCAPAAAVNVVIDYTYAPSFFSQSTTNGQRARATVEAAADYFTEILDDSFVSVQKPNDYISTAPGGSPVTFSWNWETRFTNPTTGAPVSFTNPVIPADEYRIYVGARNLGSTTLGTGGPGGFGSSEGGSWYFPEQRAEIEAISADFNSLLSNRDQQDGDFGRWGGVLSFNTSKTWNYNHTVAPSSGQNDLFSVALHEIGHAIGFGTSDEWNDLIVGGQYTGPNGIAANGSAPLLTSGHWGNGVQSTVFGGSTPQETAMDPNITVGTRKLWTTLDAAGLEDIGWEVVAPVLGLPGDYNDDGLVDAADYTTWRDNLGTPDATGTYSEWSTNYGASSNPSTSASIPEPSALVVIVSTFVAGFASKSRRKD